MDATVSKMPAPPPESPLRTLVATALRGRREELGISQREAAELVGVPKPTYADWEAGKVQMPLREHLEKIRSKMGIDLWAMHEELLAERAGEQASETLRTELTEFRREFQEFQRAFAEFQTALADVLPKLRDDR